MGTVISMESLAVSSARLVSVRLTAELYKVQGQRPHAHFTWELPGRAREEVPASLAGTTGSAGAYRPLLLKTCKSGERIHSFDF